MFLLQQAHLFFVDFQSGEGAHSVFHAVCPSEGALPAFTYANVALEEPGKVRSLFFKRESSQFQGTTPLGLQTAEP